MNLAVQLNTLWALLGTALIFLMQGGFAMVETGFTRAKNAGNVIMKALLVFACGSLAFWILGYGLLFGVGEGGFIGRVDLFVTGSYDTNGIPCGRTWRSTRCSA